MHDRVEEDLAQRIGRHRQPVLPEDLSFGEASRQGERPVQESHALADDCERVQVFLLVVNSSPSA